MWRREDVTEGGREIAAGVGRHGGAGGELTDDGI